MVVAMDLKFSCTFPPGLLWKASRIQQRTVAMDSWFQLFLIIFLLPFVSQSGSLPQFDRSNQIPKECPSLPDWHGELWKGQAAINIFITRAIGIHACKAHFSISSTANDSQETEGLALPDWLKLAFTSKGHIHGTPSIPASAAGV